VQLKGIPVYEANPNYLAGLFADEDAWNMWRYYWGPETVIQEWDTFIECVQQFGATLGLAGPAPTFDEGVQRELKSFLDPSNSGAVTIFKFAALTNLTRPFQQCLSNVHALKNCPWFHGYVSKEDAELLLKGKSPGTFLFHLPDPDPSAIYLLYVTPSNQFHSAPIDYFTPALVSIPELKSKFPALTFPYVQDISWSNAFFGSISYEDAQELLTGQPMGSYLMRLSKSSPGSFVIAYVATEGKVHQIKIDWQGHQFLINMRAYVSLKLAVKSYQDTFRTPSYLSKHEPSIIPIAERLRRAIREVPMENHYQDISKVLSENHYASVITK